MLPTLKCQIFPLFQKLSFTKLVVEMHIGFVVECESFINAWKNSQCWNEPGRISQGGN